jgi:hypothetical protein
MQDSPALRAKIIRMLPKGYLETLLEQGWQVVDARTSLF